MRHGCIVAVAAAAITAVVPISAAEAACKPGHQTTCAADSNPTVAPLQLKRFMALGPARRATSSRKSRRTARKPPARQAIAATRGAPTPPAAAPLPAEPAPLFAKPVPTVSVAVPSLALASATEAGTVGFAGPSHGEDAFARTDPQSEPPQDVMFAEADELNEIDLAAADGEASARDGGKFAGVSLMAQANATPLPEPALATPPKAETSWLSRLYSRLIDGSLAVVLAIRSLFA
jgi:hypothetical protein